MVYLFPLAVEIQQRQIDAACLEESLLHGRHFQRERRAYGRSHMPRYKIESTGNGAQWTITRLADGASVFLQGDDALDFGYALDNTANDDELCDEYEPIFQTA